MQNFKFWICAVVGAWVLIGFVGNSSRAQSGWTGVVGVESGNGRGTGFVVAVSDSQIEIWTAGHVTGQVGSPCVVVFIDGTETPGVVARRAFDGRGDGPDRAKIIADRPDIEFEIARVSRTPYRPECFAAFAGYSIGPDNQRQVEITGQGHGTFPNRITARPAPNGGDSGGPVFDESGAVVGVVTQRTLERNPRLLFIPIETFFDR